MAFNRPSSRPMFIDTPHYERGLTVDLDVDPIIRERGANQWLGDEAAHHNGQSTLGPNGNRVQSGALDLIKNSSSPFGTPTKAQPLGRQSL